MLCPWTRRFCSRSASICLFPSAPVLKFSSLVDCVFSRVVISPFFCTSSFSHLSLLWSTITKSCWCVEFIGTLTRAVRSVGFPLHWSWSPVSISKVLFGHRHRSSHGVILCPPGSVGASDIVLSSIHVCQGCVATVFIVRVWLPVSQGLPIRHESQSFPSLTFGGVWTFVFILNLFQIVRIFSCSHSNCGHASPKRGFWPVVAVVVPISGCTYCHHTDVLPERLAVLVPSVAFRFFLVVWHFRGFFFSICSLLTSRGFAFNISKILVFHISSDNFTFVDGGEKCQILKHCQVILYFCQLFSFFVEVFLPQKRLFWHIGKCTKRQCAVTEQFFTCAAGIEVDHQKCFSIPGTRFSSQPCSRINEFAT